MKAMTLPIVAASVALAMPALAQTSGSPSQQSPSSQQTQQRSQSGQSGMQGQQTMTQEKLRQQLQQAGFRNVQILDAAYLVQAQTQDGNQVMMMINPPSQSGAAGASGSGSGGTGMGGSGTGGSGTGGSGSGSGSQPRQ